MMAASASASLITYNTNAAGTEFISPTTGLTLLSTSGPAATLRFAPNVTSTTGTPSNINFGDFILTCTAGCSATPDTLFPAFTFDLVVTDTTDGATGKFVGTSAGGAVSANTSTIQVNWQAPLFFGPGTTNSLSGNFGLTRFDMVSPTSLIVAPNSGTAGAQGDTTVQGQLRSTADIPEPATLSLIGGALLGLGILRRKSFLRR
jgi:hypothetical protein